LYDIGEKSNYCLQHYLAVFAYQRELTDDVEAMDECLHHFLDQRPAKKGLSWFDRVSGLAAAPFWWETDTVKASKLSTLALSRILGHEGAISTDLLEHLAEFAPDILRWAVRFSKLFTRHDSLLWKSLRERAKGDEWRIFFGVCDRLLMQLEPFDQIIRSAEKELAHLSLLETLSYLSILAYEQLTPNASTEANSESNEWRVYSRIIKNKLKICNNSDFNINEVRLGQALKRHLSPIIFPSPFEAQECQSNLETFAILFAATKERMDYEDSIDWFCFDPECRYQLKPGSSVIYNESETGSLAWQFTEHKFQALWMYWMNRGIIEFIDRGMAGIQIGSAENHELNTQAYIKAIRSELHLKEVFGMDDEIGLSDDCYAKLFQSLLSIELHSVFFQSAYIKPFQNNYANCGNVAQALSRLAFNGLLEGENRFPMTWAEQDAKIKRIVGWTVCDEYPKGSSLAAKAILNFWTSDLRELSNNLKEQPQIPLPTLYERPFYKIGRYNFQFPWVVAQQNNLTAAINNLRRIGARRSGQMTETRRIELRLAQLLKNFGFAVEVGYQPSRTDKDDCGEIDLICHYNGIILMLEVKSGYIRSSRHEVWLHKTNTLRKAARQLKRKRPAVLDALANDDQLRIRLGCDSLYKIDQCRAWIIDTSIECDQQMIDGFLVVSLESLVIILRDEREMLLPIDKSHGLRTTKLFKNGKCPKRLIEVVENGEIWSVLD
jgi:hypothetical protein